jgi:hypothetical protein
MLACEDSTSIDCARVMRGAASSAKAAGRLRHGGDVVGVEGIEHADHDGAGAHQREFLGIGGAHLEHHVGAKGVSRAADPGAGGGIGLVGDAELMPAPAWTTSSCLAASFLTVSGVAATRVSPALFRPVCLSSCLPPG